MKMLGSTGIAVSELCFGALTIGPLQKNMPIEQGTEIVSYAIKKGINFIDTAQMYDTYKYIKGAIAGTNTVISSKTYAYTKQMAQEAVEQARRELDRDMIDIFMLHEQESIHTLKGHMEALDYLYEMKAKGVIRAVGASMHHISAVYGAMELGLDVIHPIMNFKGLGIVDGSINEMVDAVTLAHNSGIGVFCMKPLGGGNLINQRNEAIDFINRLSCVHSVAVGMQSMDEIDANVRLFNGENIEAALEDRLNGQKRRLLIQDWCTGCGECIKVCHQNALTVAEQAVVDEDKCILCGYCGSRCEQFCIKVL